jgi:hypothetical protein
LAVSNDFSDFFEVGFLLFSRLKLPSQLIRNLNAAHRTLLAVYAVNAANEPLNIDLAKVPN